MNGQRELMLSRWKMLVTVLGARF